jgi:hypothetical protein
LAIKVRELKGQGLGATAIAQGIGIGRNAAAPVGVGVLRGAARQPHTAPRSFRSHLNQKGWGLACVFAFTWNVPL